MLHHKPKPWVEAWRQRVGLIRADKKLKLSNEIGTDFHAEIEALLANKPRIQPRFKRVNAMFIVWYTWLMANAKFTPMSIEFKVWSKVHRYQGTLDCVAKIGRRLVLFDWKTSAGIYADMAIQLVAYAKAYEERTGHIIKTGIIVLVTKKRPHKLIVKEYKLGKRLFNKFLKLRREMPEPVCSGVDVIDLS